MATTKPGGLLTSQGQFSYKVPPPALPRAAVLMSYWYMRDVDVGEFCRKAFTEPYPYIFCDSGAFTAFTQGKPIDVDAYADFLHQWKHLFTAYASLDVKGDVDAGLKNLARLESKGLRPLPVFHGGEPWSVLKDMIVDYSYIALGGIAKAKGTDSTLLKRWLNHAFGLASGKSVFHGFGITSLSALVGYPWYSADSTTWLSLNRYGHGPIFDHRSHQFVECWLRSKDWHNYSGMIRSYGFDPNLFHDPEKYHSSIAVALSARSFQTANGYLRTIRSLVPIAGDTQAPLGPIIYLSDSTVKFLSIADRTFKNWQTGRPALDGISRPERKTHAQ